MKLEILKRTEKDEILEMLEKQFGIKKLPYLLVRQGREKLRAFTGEASKEELLAITRELNVEILGIYFGKLETGGIRLSIDATNLLASQITKNILELDDNEIIQWMRGNNLEINKEEQGYKIIKNNNDFFGTGKASNGILYNFVPKDRRIKN